MLEVKCTEINNMNIKALGTALKNKIVDKTSDVLAAPKVKYYESKSRQSDKNYNFIKDYQAKKKNGVTTQKEDAQYQGMQN